MSARFHQWGVLAAMTGVLLVALGVAEQMRYAPGTWAGGWTSDALYVVGVMLFFVAGFLFVAER